MSHDEIRWCSCFRFEFAERRYVIINGKYLRDVALSLTFPTTLIFISLLPINPNHIVTMSGMLTVKASSTLPLIMCRFHPAPCLKFNQLPEVSSKVTDNPSKQSQMASFSQCMLLVIVNGCIFWWIRD